MISTDTAEQADSSASSSDESVKEVDTPFTTKELIALVKVIVLAVVPIGFLTCYT